MMCLNLTLDFRVKGFGFRGLGLIPGSAGRHRSASLALALASFFQVDLWLPSREGLLSKPEAPIPANKFSTMYKLCLEALLDVMSRFPGRSYMPNSCDLAPGFALMKF